MFTAISFDHDLTRHLGDFQRNRGVHGYAERVLLARIARDLCRNNQTERLVPG
jgi:hypothetical protein